MKKIITLSCILLAGAALSQSLQAQSTAIKWPDYKFETDIENPITPVKNQYRSGTCWCFAGIGFLESEVIRINGIKDTLKYPDFSEMFVVSKSYQARAEKYVRVDGNLGFSSGSESDDVLDVVRDWGIVPQSAMSGMNYGTELPEQAELDAVAHAYVQSVSTKPNRTLTTAWKRGFEGIMNAYLGECPESFEVDGVSYTPASYRDALGIVPADYVSLTSFTHHPFYTSFALELSDNWRGDSSYNLPVDELVSVIDNALEKGYTLAWAADVSETGFTRDGYAILVDVENTNKAGSDQEHWVGKEEGAPKPVAAPAEKTPTQETRQAQFDNKTLTDDHGMLIYGTAHDQFGNKYYKVKNSWGDTGRFHGLWYASTNFVAGQTISVTVHKDALPKDIRKKLGLK